MKLTEIRALNIGATLHTLDGRRVTYAGTAYGPSATHSRCTYAIVQNADGSRTRELPGNLTCPTAQTAAQKCTCVHTCAEDPQTACSLSGQWHVHPDNGLGIFGPCPEHPDAPGDL